MIVIEVIPTTQAVSMHRIFGLTPETGILANFVSEQRGFYCFLFVQATIGVDLGVYEIKQRNMEESRYRQSMEKA